MAAAASSEMELRILLRDLASSGLTSFRSAIDSTIKTVFSLQTAIAAVASAAAFSIIADDFRRAELAISDAVDGSIEDLEKLQKVSQRVYLLGFGENAKEGAEIAAKAFRELGSISEESLAQASIAALQLQDRFGADYQEVLTATGTLMREFGISAEQALDFVTSGFQKNLDSSGDFLDSINEYTVQFSNAGANADEFFSILIDPTSRRF